MSGWGYMDTGFLPGYRRIQSEYGTENPFVVGFPVSRDSTGAAYRRTIESEEQAIDVYSLLDHGDSGGPLMLLSAADPAARDQIGVAWYISDELRDPTVSKVSTAWADITFPQTAAWIEATASDPTEPGRWVDERDYTGSIRPLLDADADYRFDGPSPGCRHLFDVMPSTWLDKFNPDLERALPALAGEQEVRVNDGVAVYNGDGSLASVAVGNHRRRTAMNPTSRGAYARVGVDAQIGQIFAEGASVDVAPRATVTSIAYDAGGLSVDPSAKVQSVQSSVLRMPSIRLSERFTPLYTPSSNCLHRWGQYGENCSIEPGETVEIQSDGYRYLGVVSVKSNAHLILSGKVFHFDQLNVDDGGIVTVYDSAGAGGSSNVSIWLKSGLILRGNLSRGESAGLASGLLIGYFGTSEVSIRHLNATIVAPRAKVTLESPSQPANGVVTHRGAVYAQRVEVHQGGIFLADPLMCLRNAVY